MGLLKHFVLPFYLALHLWSAVPIFLGHPRYLAETLEWPGKEDPPGPIELHMWGAYAGVCVAMIAGCLAGIFLENAHFRGVLVFMEVCFWGGDCYDSYFRGFPYEGLVVFTLIGVIGLAVHSQEPGIFTKDKTKAKSG